jgi:hypothetical protein
MVAGVLGMAGAGLAILFGMWVMVGAVIAYFNVTPISGIHPIFLLSVAAVAGGILYLLGLMRWRGTKGFRARVGGFVLFGTALLLPTTVWMIQLAVVAMAVPGIFFGQRAELAPA